MQKIGTTFTFVNIQHSRVERTLSLKLCHERRMT